MAERKVVPFDEFYYQLKLTHLFQKHPVYIILVLKNQAPMPWKFSKNIFSCRGKCLLCDKYDKKLLRKVV
jgi:hypothetical protein